jgi:predicted ABC-type sugar transport system permease subunit
VTLATALCSAHALLGRRQHAPAVLILGTLNNGLTLMNVSSFWQDVTRGVVLLAVSLDQIRTRGLGE